MTITPQILKESSDLLDSLLQYEAFGPHCPQLRSHLEASRKVQLTPHTPALCHLILTDTLEVPPVI